MQMRTAMGLGLILAVGGCAVVGRVVNPEQARLEEESEKRRMEVSKYPDGECARAEVCKDRCEILERALDCYKTGKAALRGVDVNYQGGWRVEKVSGSTDDVRLRHDAASQEHVSLAPLAREAFGRACTAKHGESCRLSGQLVAAEKPEEAATFYRKACDLQDKPACELLSRKRP